MPFGFGRLVEPAYRFVVARRNARFDAGIGVRKADIPVICVGNLSVGGTGKTPLVMWLVEHLRTLGCTPGIAMRGYKAKRGELSDEQAEYATRLPGVMVAVDAERFNAVQALARHGRCNVAVLDDGFQHRRLARDLDIVLLDATRAVFTDRCLPAGWLREPVQGLARAGAIVWTHAEAIDDDALHALLEQTRAIAPNAALACARHTWTGLACAGEDELRPVASLQDQNVAVACGIGNPTALCQAIEAHGARIVSRLIRADHYPWSSADLADLHEATQGAAMLLTTEKDWVKLRSLALHDSVDIPILRPQVSMEIVHGKETLLAKVGTAIARPDATVPL